MKIGLLSQASSSGHTYANKQFEQAFSQEHEVANLVFGGAKETDFHFAAKFFQNPSLVEDLNFTDLSVEHYATIKEWIDKEGIDAIFFNEVFDWNLIEKLGQDVKTIGYILMDRLENGTPPLYERMFDLNLICNERGYEIFSAAKNIKFVPWGVDTEKFKPSGKKPETDFVHSAGWGGVNYRKCTPEVVRQWYKTDSTLTLATQAITYDHRTAEIVRAERNNRLNLLFSTKSPEEIYQKGRVYLGPSKFEGLGLYIPEAMASGLPVITTDAPPMNQFVRDQENGLLVSVADKFNRQGFELQGVLPDETELRENMEWALANPKKIKEMGKKAREFILENHTLDIFANRVNKVVKHV